MMQYGAAIRAVFWRVVAAFIAVCVLALGGSPVLAQSVTIVNGTDGALSEFATPCANPLVRNFLVSNTFQISDVDIGLRGTHSFRGDVRVTLKHPDGTSVQVVNGSGSISGDNFNFLLDDGAGQLVNTDGNSTNHTGNAVNGGFQNTFRPNSALSVFNGKQSNGLWRLEVCDQFNADTGNFRHAELYLTAALANFADLSLSKSVSNSSPTSGQQVTYTISVQNSASSSQTAAATVIDQLPAGATYSSHSGYGTYVPATGVWTLPAIAPNQTRTLSIIATVGATSGATITNIAEIETSDRADSDSTPGNSASSEDDYASASFTVAGARIAGTAPSLICPDGQLAFNWAGRSWPAGSTANNYTLAGFGAFNWSISNPATWMNITALGGLQPALTNGAQGVTSLSKGIDFANRDQIAVTTITMGAIVDGAQFTIFDVDYAANDFADLVRVTGLRGGTTVIPVLTNGVTNYVIGNTAYGDAGADSASAEGDVIITFNQPVDTIVIEYGNHSLAPNNPDGQAIQMSGGITVCRPVADLAVTKTSAMVSDPVSGTTSDAFVIPQAVMEYCIAITNNGSATASLIVANDLIPTNVTFVPGSILSGNDCQSAATIEDDDASDAGEPDTIGASFASGTVSMAVSSLGSGETVVLTFEAVVK